MDLKQAIGAALAAGVFVTIPAIAADTASNSDRQRADQQFDRLDTNHDGNIDQSEAAARPWLQQNFSRFDHDGNGKLGKDEFAEAVSAARAARADMGGGGNAYADIEPLFYSLDKNHDGNVDQAEAAAVPSLQQSFSQYDHDRDGKLGKDEFAEAVHAQHIAGLGAPSAAAGGTASTAQPNFESLDKNNDGNIDATEAAALPWLQQNFSQYDTDHNGKLGKDEFASAVKSQPAAAGGTSAAAGASSTALPSFESLDKNNDGNIDTSEAAAAPWLQQNFSRFDHDRDGKLGKDEFREAQGAQPK